MKIMRSLMFFLAFLFLGGFANGELHSKAKIGGTFILNLRGEPNTLHPIKAIDFFSRRIFDFTMDSLAAHNDQTYEMEPHLAEKWEVSKDQKVMTFTLRNDLTFHDGHSLTAEDVKFSFDAILEPSPETQFLKPFFENLDKVEVIDSKTVRFTFKNTYYKNFEQIATRIIIPKHVYGDSKTKINYSKELVGSGPYKLENYSRGDKLVLKRYSNWYGFKLPLFDGRFNFEQIVAKFIRDENMALEMLKKGDLDFTEIRPEAYQNKTTGEPWGSKILKVKYENLEPKNWYFYGMNLKNPLFYSRKIRLALAHLMDRESMSNKILYGFSKPASAPIWFQNPAHPDGVKPVPFDISIAEKLLKEEGWSDSDGNGILDKVINKKRIEFKFTLIYPSRDYEKFHTWYQEDLREVGIDMDPKFVDWFNFESTIKSGQFDMMAMAWGGGDQEPDPKQLWHSQSRGPGGSNFIGFENKKIDRLIDSARVQPDFKKRTTQFQKIYSMIADEVPYIFWFDTVSEFYAVSSRIHRSMDTLKYKVGVNQWWVEK